MVKVLPTLIKHPQKVFWWLFALDLTIVVLHIFWGSSHTFFHLDLEKNLPTAYQSLKLIGFASLYTVLLFRKKATKATQLFVIPLSIVLLSWGLDELFQIHENIYRLFEYLPWLHPSKVVSLSMQLGYRSSLWILYYLPFIFLFVLWCGYWLRTFQTTLRINFPTITLSIICLFVVLIAEVISSTGMYSETVYFWIITCEEMAEMLFATTLVTAGLRSIGNGLKFSDIK